MASNLKQLNNLELSAFCSQMAMILKAGISPLEGVSIMKKDASCGDDKKILEEIESVISQTGSFYTAIISCGVFPKYFVNMAQIGEQAGKLDDVMDSLSLYYQREAQVAASIKQAITYPFIMIAMMLVVVLVLIMKVLPAFSDAYSQLGHELTGFSKVVLQISEFLNQYYLELIGVFAFCILLFLFFAGTKSGRRLFIAFARTLGMGRKLFHLAAATRIAGGMAIILSSGLNIEHSMQLASSLVDDPKYKRRMKNVEKSVTSGIQIDEALRQEGIFSGIYVHMASVAYKTGTMDEVMKKIAVHYEDELNDEITAVISVLEPTLVIVLSAFIGAVLLSVMLPLLGVMAGF